MDDERRRIAAWAHVLWDKDTEAAGRQLWTMDSSVGVRSMGRQGVDVVTGYRGQRFGIRPVYLLTKKQRQGNQRSKKQIQRLRKEERKAKASRGAHPAY